MISGAGGTGALPGTDQTRGGRDGLVSKPREIDVAGDDSRAGSRGEGGTRKTIVENGGERWKYQYHVERRHYAQAWPRKARKLKDEVRRSEVMKHLAEAVHARWAAGGGRGDHGGRRGGSRLG